MDSESIRAFLNNGLDKKDAGLTALEFRILALLARRPDVVLSRSYILSSIWGPNIAVTGRTIDTHISHLRKKITGSNLEIKAVAGEGYRLTINQSAR